MNHQTTSSMFGDKSTKKMVYQPDAPASPASPASPISEMLHAIEQALSRAHEEFSMLDNKIEPIRASAPETVSEGIDPSEMMPTQMENQLRNIYDTVRYLGRRIETTRSELRI